jgi:uncharacterized protein (DUF433 family)
MDHTTNEPATEFREHGQTWKVIPGYENYEVSDDGQVRSWTVRFHPEKRSEFPRVLIPIFVGKDRRPAVCLCRYGESRRFYIHTLVLQSFVGPRPEGYEACHNDGNTQNNSIENLRWDTHRRNEQDKRAHGTSPAGEKNGSSKLTHEDVATIRDLSQQGERHDEIAGRFGVTPGAINRITRGKRWASANGPIHSECAPYQNKHKKTNYFALHPEIAKGENNGRAILNEQQVRQIKQRVRDGEKRSDMASEYGVSKATIDHIITGRLWKHID